MELTKTKYKQTEIGLIPEDWSIISFGEIADNKVKWSITGGPFGSDLKTSDYTTSGVQVIQLQNIGDGQFIDDSQVYVSEDKADSLLSANIYPNEIILSKMGDPVARACFMPNKAERYVMASDGIRLVVDEKKFNKKFLHDYINSEFFRVRAFDVSTGSTRLRIGLPNLKSLLLVNPPLPEQKAIAEVLSDVDSLIQAIEQKLAKKRAIKQGAMQKLLTPKEDWERVSLNDVIEVNRGGSPRPIQDYITTSNNGVNWIKIGDTSRTSKYITSSKEKIIQEGILNSREVKVGDFLLSNSMSFGRPYILKIDGCIHDGWLVLQNYQNSFDREFLYYTLMSKDVYNQYLTKASGSGVLNLNKELVKTIELNMPKTIEEQIRIATILSDMDKEIELIEAQLAKYQVLKQGLMQELLTGRIRITV